eukprot:766628-Hanusia_phi.AAC.6
MNASSNNYLAQASLSLFSFTPLPGLLLHLCQSPSQAGSLAQPGSDSPAHRVTRSDPSRTAIRNFAGKPGTERPVHTVSDRTAESRARPGPL